MKANFIFHLVCIVLLASACQKEEPEIPLANQVVGEYTIHKGESELSDYDFPFTDEEGNTYSIEAVVSKNSDFELKIIFIITKENDTVRIGDPTVLEPFEIAKANGKISGTYGVHEVEFSGQQILLRLSYESGEILTYTGTKNTDS
ncbi:hypothetical protein LAG90_01470 [Marinilongibacter aquaticus]|uniref:hypothetical protein n=1 Tax=Marinilongibacter aquaticus TaxID=2975157 RepID=UPI0021BDDD83|nr:hypothetical protein [Marinilongibacter aquaticus]UBM59326.1 hypothetical protein LAG90_01470 [Marinilongibacter aquaticus]